MTFLETALGLLDIFEMQADEGRERLAHLAETSPYPYWRKRCLRELITMYQRTGAESRTIVSAMELLLREELPNDERRNLELQLQFLHSRNPQEQ